MSSPAASEQEGLLNRYAQSDELGSGRFGRSVLATDSKTNSLCTLKYINAPLCDGTSAILNSYLRIKHPNVLRHLAFISNHRRSTTGVADSTVIVTEFAGFGSLKREVDRRREMFMESDSTKEVFGAAASEASSYGVLSSCGGSDIHAPSSSTESQVTPFEDSSPGIYFSLLDIIQIMIQLLLAIRHLHKQKEVHRDITLQNIFITEPDRVIKLGHCHAFDYEVMTGLQPPELASAIVTPINSPRGNRTPTRTLRHWKEPCDIWALGCTLYEIMTLRPIRSNWEQFLGFYLRQHCSEEWAGAFERIIKSCLQPDPADRATISMIMSMRELLLAYNLLVSNRDIAAQAKMRHVLYYWEKSGSRKLQLKGITPTAVYIPQPTVTLPPLKQSTSLTRNTPEKSLSEEQILSPGRCQEKGVNITSSISHGEQEDNSNLTRAGRSYKLPTIGNPAHLSAVGPILQQPTEYRLLSRSTIRRSLSQEARDKFSKIDCRSVMQQPRALCQGFPSARSARGSKADKTSNSESPSLKHRQTIASSAVRSATRSSRTPKISCAEAKVELRTATLSRETTPPAPLRASMMTELPDRAAYTPSTKVTRVGRHYEVLIPREDRLGVWRDVQSRDHEYNMIELAMKACVLTLEETMKASHRQEDDEDVGSRQSDPKQGSTRTLQTNTPPRHSKSCAIPLSSSPPPPQPPAPPSYTSVEDPLDRIPLMVSEHKPSGRLPIPVTASRLFARSTASLDPRLFSSSAPRAPDLVRLVSGDKTSSLASSADCRRTIGRSSIYNQLSSGPALPTAHLNPTVWLEPPSEGGLELSSFSKFGLSGRYRSASHEHNHH